MAGVPFIEIAVFFVLLLAFDLLDYWLPMNDLAEMSAPLAISSLLVLGEPWGALLPLLARVAAIVLKHRQTIGSALWWPMARRICAVVMTLVVVYYGRANEISEPMTALIAGVVYVIGDTLVLQLSSVVRGRRSLLALVVGNFRLQGWVLLTQVSAGILAAILFREIGLWGLALVAVLMAVVRQSFVLLIEIRRAYSSTIEAIVAAVELEHGERGYAQLLAAKSTELASAMGIGGESLECLRYAALLYGAHTPRSGDEVPVDYIKVLEKRVQNGPLPILSDVLAILSVLRGEMGGAAASEDAAKSAAVIETARRLVARRLRALRDVAAASSVERLPDAAR